MVTLSNFNNKNNMIAHKGGLFVVPAQKNHKQSNKLPNIGIGLTAIVSPKYI